MGPQAVDTHVGWIRLNWNTTFAAEAGEEIRLGFAKRCIFYITQPVLTSSPWPHSAPGWGSRNPWPGGGIIH